MEGIKYVNLIEIGSVVIEIQGVKNGDLAVPSIVCRTSFLATDTQLCLDTCDMVSSKICMHLHALRCIINTCDVCQQISRKLTTGIPEVNPVL